MHKKNENIDEHHRNETIDNGEIYLSKLRKRRHLNIRAGQVQPRKGVDIFISVANNINKAISNKSVRFRG